MSAISAGEIEERRRSRLHVALGIFTLIVVAAAQALLDPALPLDLLFVLPVAVIAMAGGRPLGVTSGVAAAVLRSLVELWRGPGHEHPAIAVLSFLLGALVYMLTAWFAAEITTAALRARASALTDPLTGLGNRRFFEDVAERELNRSQRYARPLALAFINIDDFRSVNEERGHAAGDALLRRVAQELPSGIRRSDIVARLGGDVFAVLLPETPAEGAEVAMGKLRERLRATAREGGFDVRFSVGVATLDTGATTLKALMSAADATMYAAKRTGQGLVVGDASLPVTQVDAAADPD
ncbi:MAG TPA: GGDEF domain-containing protein [Longimicrobiales bacterium]|nr:GGDEF domain-containing protein [Longimicrobiales bacterium]